LYAQLVEFRLYETVLTWIFISYSGMNWYRDHSSL